MFIWICLPYFPVQKMRFFCQDLPVYSILRLGVETKMRRKATRHNERASSGRYAFVRDKFNAENQTKDEIFVIMSSQLKSMIRCTYTNAIFWTVLPPCRSLRPSKSNWRNQWIHWSSSSSPFQTYITSNQHNNGGEKQNIEKGDNHNNDNDDDNKNNELFREHRRKWEKVDIVGCTRHLNSWM